MRQGARIGLAALVLAAALDLGVLTPRVGPTPGFAAPASWMGPTAAEIVLDAGDIGPDFVVQSAHQSVRGSSSSYTRTLVRQAGGTAFLPTIAPDGIVVVRSFALVAPEFERPGRLFEADELGVSLRAEAVPIPAVGEDSWGGIVRGDGPFEPARKLVLFRAGPALAGVVVAGYDAPDSMDDIVALAQKMAARAAR
jgi:hypothetical protein